MIPGTISVYLRKKNLEEKVHAKAQRTQKEEKKKRRWLESAA